MSDADFEVRLAHQLNEYAAAGVRPIDRYAMAQGSIAAGSKQGLGLRIGLRLGALRPVPGVASRVLFVVLTLLALAFALWVVGERHAIPPGRLAYIQDGDVYVAGTDGGEAAKLLDDPAVDFTRVTWLDGGTTLAVEGQGLVSVLDLATGERRRVGSIGNSSTWRPGGHEYADFRYRDGIPSVMVIVDAQTGASHELPTDQEVDDPTWSPDGRWLVGESGGSLLVADVVTGDTRVVRTSAGDESDPAVLNGFADIGWSPDSTHLTYVASTNGACTGDDPPICTSATKTAFVVPMDGESPTAIAGPIIDDISPTVGYYNLGPTLLPTWSPDGEWIAYRGGPGLSIVRPDGSGQHALVTSPIAWFSWAADSSGLVFVATANLDDARGELSWIGLTDASPRSLGVAGVGPLDIVGRPWAGVTAPLPSAAPSAASAVNAVVTPPPASPTDPSAKWRGLAFSDSFDRDCQTVWQLDFGSSGDPRAVTDCAPRALVDPDGIHAAVGDPVVDIVDMRDGSRTLVATNLVARNGDRLNWLDWSPGGRWLTWRGGGKDVIVDADGNGATVLPTVTGGTWDLPNWSPDDSHVAVAMPDRLLVGDGSGSGLVDIGPFGGVSSWSHDGRRFVTIRDGDAWVVNDDGTGARNISDFEFGGIWQTAMSPDGESVAIAQAARVLWLIGLDGSRRQVELGPRVSLEYVDLRWSSDGQLLAVETRPSDVVPAGTTFLVPIDGSPVVRLDDAWNPTWSPDGRYLALQSIADGIAGIDVANADGSGRVTLSSRPVEAWGELAWVP